MKQKIKQYFRKFFLINDTPHKIAGGAALGIFLGIFPGEGVASTLVLSTVFRLNRLAATAGVLATNTWTTFFIVPLAAIVGGFLFHINPSILIQNFEQTFQSGLSEFFTETIFFQIALPLLSGFFIVSGIVAIGFYFILLYLLKKDKIELTENGKIFDPKASLKRIKKQITK
ncbi:MAG: DUF2062 domain-containing protein [Candidatus Moranbacteria bacterium]|nr:DUF2062 domain-containing protein [Candidatus Moranbacteria bacterium]